MVGDEREMRRGEKHNPLKEMSSLRNDNRLQKTIGGAREPALAWKARLGGMELPRCISPKIKLSPFGKQQEGKNGTEASPGYGGNALC